jgi:hypothetical protein
MAETEPPEAKCRVYPDMAPEFCRYVRNIIEPWLHALGKHDQHLITNVIDDTLLAINEAESPKTQGAHKKYVRIIARRMLTKLQREERRYVPAKEFQNCFSRV